MMKHTPAHLSTAASVDAPIVRETVAMFLARGGHITKCPPKMAHGAMMYAPVIAVDGHTIALGTSGNEYVPNFVRDLSTYDTAQNDPVTVEDDGSSSMVREDLAHQMRPNVEWRERMNHTLRREDADIMEELV